MCIRDSVYTRARNDARRTPKNNRHKAANLAVELHLAAAALRRASAARSAPSCPSCSWQWPNRAAQSVRQGP
eukprot:7615846-Alexandrium_andersonii.AAC.1